MVKEKEKSKATDNGILSESISSELIPNDDDPEINRNKFRNNPGGIKMDEEKKEPTFSDYVRQYGVDKAIARGLQTKMAVKSDDTVKETDFVKTLKEFTMQTPG